MFNLLPPNLKEMIVKGYKWRRLALVFVFAIGVEATFLIFLFPTWLMSGYRERAVVAQSEQMNQFLTNSNINPATGVIKSLNTKLGIINTNLENPKILPLIDVVISKRTSAITLTQFIYSATASSSADMSIQGVSATREALVSFEKRLEDSKRFKKVDLPISNLAKDKDIDFTINLSI